jgi:predicted acylesterase/phospholipase RssA
MLLEKADVIIRPQVGDVHWSEFRNAQAMIAEGERATKFLLPEIQHLLEQKRSFWQRLFKTPPR